MLKRILSCFVFISLAAAIPATTLAASLLDEQEEADLMQQQEDELFADGWDLILENSYSSLFKKDFGDYFELTLLRVGQAPETTRVTK